VPINLAKEILPQLKANGSVIRGWLGVSVQEVTPELASALKLDVKEGALVAQTNPGSPADKAGVQRGDVIETFNGKPVVKPRDLSRTVASTPVGSSVPIEVLRDGKTVKLTAKIEKLASESEETAQAGGGEQEHAGADSLGLQITDIDDDIRQQLELKPGAKGAIIAAVEPGSPAADAGLRPGDLIVEVNKKGVSSAEEADKRIAAAGDSVLFLVKRGDGTLFVAVNRKG
jgi:serine protease Do